MVNWPIFTCKDWVSDFRSGVNPLPDTNTSLLCSINCFFHFKIKLLLIPYWWDRSVSVWSPLILAKATFDLNFGKDFCVSCSFSVALIHYINNHTGNSLLAYLFHCTDNQDYLSLHSSIAIYQSCRLYRLMLFFWSENYAFKLFYRRFKYCTPKCHHPTDP